MSAGDVDARTDAMPRPTIRPIDILTALPHSSSTTAFTPIAPAKHLRPIDILHSIRERRPSSSVTSLNVQDPPPATLIRPIDIIAGLKERPTSTSNSSLPGSSSRTTHPVRPVDVLASLKRPTTSPFLLHSKTTGPSLPAPVHAPSQISRDIAPLPKRARPKSISNLPPPKPVLQRHDVKPYVQTVKSPTAVPLNDNDHDIIMNPPTTIYDSTFLDLTIDPPRTPLSSIIELTDTSSDDDCDIEVDTNPVHDPETDIDMRPVSFVFNTNLPINPRQTARPWVGSLRPQDWVPSREELHAEQVDFDRSLPSEMHHAGYPVYVRRHFFIGSN